MKLHLLVASTSTGLYLSWASLPVKHVVIIAVLCLANFIAGIVEGGLKDE